MQVELKDIITVAVAISGLALSFYFGSKTKRRNDKCDDRDEASELTRFSVKLDFILDDVGEIKNSVKSQQVEGKDTRERLVKVEESTKQAHKRIDQMQSYRAKPPDAEEC